MSFGVSIGNFIAVGRLIQDIVSSLRASSISEYRELIRELDGLHRALHEIEHLKCHPSQQPALNSVKIAALMCQHPLDEFAGKLKRFEIFGQGKAEPASRVEKAKKWGKKLKWGFFKEEEVVKFRAYLVAHVGSLNMRLATQGLTSTFIVAEQIQKGHEDLETRLEKFHLELAHVRDDLQANRFVARGGNPALVAQSSLHCSDLLSFVNTTQASQTLTEGVKTPEPSPESRHACVQEPIRFGDATEQVIPIPSEHDWVETVSDVGRIEGRLSHKIPTTDQDCPTTLSRAASAFSGPYRLASSEVASVSTTQMAWTLPASMSPLLLDYNTATSTVAKYPACSKEFRGCPRDTNSNLRLHLRASPRHNRNQGLKCPRPECRTKPPMRSDNLGPHLLNVHKITSPTERQSTIKNARLSAKGVAHSTPTSLN